jgi:hypothetical protein
MGIASGLLQGIVANEGYSDLVSDLDDSRTTAATTIGAAGVDGAAGTGLIGSAQDQGSFDAYTMRSGQGTAGFDPVTGQTGYDLNEQQQAQADAMSTGGQTMMQGSQTMDPRFAGAANVANQQAYGSALRGQNAYGASNQAMQNSMQDTAGREGDIYERIRAMQRPGEERGRDDMNAGLFGSGRGGMSSAAYGGSPEQAAFGQAQAEARNTASFQAMGQAQNEMMNQGNLASQYGQLSQGYGQNAQGWQGQGLQALTQGGQYQGMQSQIGNQMLQNQYLGQDQLRQNFGQAQNNQQMLAQNNQSQAGLMATLGLGGLTTDVNYANIIGDLEAKKMEALGAAAAGVGEGLDSAFQWVRESVNNNNNENNSTSTSEVNTVSEVNSVNENNNNNQSVIETTNQNNNNNVSVSDVTTTN